MIIAKRVTPEITKSSLSYKYSVTLLIVLTENRSAIFFPQEVPGTAVKNVSERLDSEFTFSSLTDD